MRRPVPVLIALPLVLLLVAACGGGTSSSSTAPRKVIEVEGGQGEHGTPKKATAPNAPGAPAGSKVLACKVAGAEARELRSTAVACGTARELMREWRRSHACEPGSRSRSSCTLGGFRCQAIRAGGAAAVSCARPGGDVAFLVKSRPLRKGGSG